MIWVIPMSGKGTRTQSLGEFKLFIEIKGSPMLSWFISSVKHNIKPEDELIFLTTDYFFNKYDFKNKVREIINYHKLANKRYFIRNQDSPAGVSLTVYAAKPLLDTSKPVIVIFPDQYIDFQMPTLEPNTAYLGINIQLSNKYGFVEIKEGLITKFVEKKNISNIASTGFYITPSGKDLVWALEQQFKSHDMHDGEYYIGPAFNFLLGKGVKARPVKVFAKYDLGTPELISYFTGKNFLCL